MTVYVEYYYNGDIETLKNNGYVIRKHRKKTNEFEAYKFKEKKKNGEYCEYLIVINRILFENMLQNDAIGVIKYDIRKEKNVETHVLPHIKDLIKLGLVERKEFYL